MHRTYFGSAGIMLGLVCFPTEVASHVCSAVTYVFGFACCVCMHPSQFWNVWVCVCVCLIFVLGCSSMSYLGCRDRMLSFSIVYICCLDISHWLDANVELILMERAGMFRICSSVYISSEEAFMWMSRSCCWHAKIIFGDILFWTKVASQRCSSVSLFGSALFRGCAGLSYVWYVKCVWVCVWALWFVVRAFRICGFGLGCVSCPQCISASDVIFVWRRVRIS